MTGPVEIETTVQDLIALNKELKISYKNKIPLTEWLGVTKGCDIPDWMKTDYRIKKEVRRQFYAELQKQMEAWLAEEEQRWLYGDPSIKEPIGIINAFAKEAK